MPPETTDFRIVNTFTAGLTELTGQEQKAIRTTASDFQPDPTNPDAWATLNSAVPRPFPRPALGRIVVKVINSLGDEAMKVFRV